MYTVQHLGFEFEFKTKAQSNKFQECIEKYALETSTKLQKIYNDIFIFNAVQFALIRLYYKVSPRHFKITCIGDGTVWQDLNEVEFEIFVTKRLPI